MGVEFAATELPFSVFGVSLNGTYFVTNVSAYSPVSTDKFPFFRVSDHN